MLLKVDDRLPFGDNRPRERISKWLESESGQGKETIVMDQCSLMELLGQASSSEAGRSFREYLRCGCQRDNTQRFPLGDFRCSVSERSGDLRCSAQSQDLLAAHYGMANVCRVSLSQPSQRKASSLPSAISRKA